METTHMKTVAVYLITVPIFLPSRSSKGSKSGSACRSAWLTPVPVGPSGRSAIMPPDPNAGLPGG